MLLIADVFQNFLRKCFEALELHPALLFSAAGLVWQICLKKTEIELELLVYIDMLQILEKGIRPNMLCNSSICRGK